MAPHNAASREQPSAWVENVREALRSVSTGDAYANGLGMLTTPAHSRVISAYGANYTRLLELTPKYYPSNFFRLNPSIKPD
jgi:hypothetical protein